MKIKTKLKITLIALLLLCLTFSFIPTIASVKAEETKITISELLTNSEYSAQNVTTNLPFSVNFEGATTDEQMQGWQTAGSLSTGNVTIVGNMTSEDEITTTGADDAVNKTNIKYNEIGASNGSNAMLLINTASGVSAIETKEYFNIPARSIYLLTVDVQVARIEKSKGVYIQLVEGENVYNKNEEDNLIKYSISQIKSTVKKEDDKDKTTYVTYSFLIYGHELIDTKAKLQISLGNRTTEDDETTTIEEIGVAAIDNLNMFTLSSEQAAKIATESNVTKANFSTINNDLTAKVKNGAFNTVASQGYNLSDIKLFTPSNWTQTTSLNNSEAEFGIINTNSTMFSSKYSSNPLVINPGLTTYQSGTNADLATKYNNVLMLLNKTQTHQRLTSEKFKLAKNQVYELSFEFCTPALNDAFTSENNSLTFVVKSGSQTIYSRENVFSYEESEHAKNLTKWSRYSLIIETADTSKDLTFEVIFGTENNAKLGSAFVDNVRVDTRSSEKAFNNIYENKLELKDGETTYLEKDYATLEEVKNLKENNYVETYEFKNLLPESTTTTPSTDKKDETSADSTTEQGFDLVNLWYIIPSALLAVCTIVGLIVFYTKKLNKKTKKHLRKNKKSKGKITYSRPSVKTKETPLTKETNKTKEKVIVENKSIEAESKIEEKVVTDEIKNVLPEKSNSEIEKLEKDYADGKISVKAYLAKREKLESKN